MTKRMATETKCTDEMVAAGSGLPSWGCRAGDNSKYCQRKLAARQSSRDVSSKRWTGARGEDTGRTGKIDKICDKALPIGIRIDTVSIKN